MEHKKIRRALRHISVGVAGVVFCFCACATEEVAWWWPAAMILSGTWLALYCWANPYKERSK